MNKHSLLLFNLLIGPSSAATTPGQGGPGSNGNEGVLCIPQSSSIAGTSPSDCLVSYQDTRWGEVLPLCREAVGVFYSLSRLGNLNFQVVSQKVVFTEVLREHSNNCELRKRRNHSMEYIFISRCWWAHKAWKFNMFPLLWNIKKKKKKKKKRVRLLADPKKNFVQSFLKTKTKNFQSKIILPSTQ